MSKKSLRSLLLILSFILFPAFSHASISLSSLTASTISTLETARCIFDPIFFTPTPAYCNKEVVTPVTPVTKNTTPPPAPLLNQGGDGSGSSPLKVIGPEPTIIQGSQGLQGLTGPQGPKGERGPSGSTSGDYVTQNAFDKQVNGILSSIEKNISGLSDQLNESVSTDLLTVSGNATIGGDLVVTSINGNTVTTGSGTLYSTTPGSITSSQLATSLTDETGTGSIVLATSPTFNTSITTPLVIGGADTTSTLTLRATSGVGTTGSDIIFQTGNNGGTEAMRIADTGNIGIGIAPDASMKLYLSSTITDATHYGEYINVTSNYTGGASSSIEGARILATYGYSTSFGTIQGLLGGAMISNNTGPKTITAAKGLVGTVVDSGDNTTITSAIGGDFSTSTASSMMASVFTEAIGVKAGVGAGSGQVSITNGYGLKITPFTKSGAITGTLGTIYGTYIGDQSGQGFTTDYNFYSAGINSKNIFDGKVGIGTTTPSSALEVVGDIVSKGTKWTARTAAEANSWTSVTYGNGLFVAVGSGGNNSIMTSVDGVTWIGRGNPEANTWSSVTYGNGQFVAVASEGTHRVMTSPDGITWTVRTAAEANGWSSVTYGNGLFVAVGIDNYEGGTHRVMTSPDGITWTARSSTDEESGWRAVTYGNGQFVAVAIGAGSTGINGLIMTSPDGIIWTERTAPDINAQYWSVTYGNGLFVAVSFAGSSSSLRFVTSSDGITWTNRSAATSSQSWTAVTYGNGLFVALSATGRVNVSPDGITWTAKTAAATNQWMSIAYGNGTFVAVSITGTNRVMTSGKSETTVIPTNNLYQGGMTINGFVGLGMTPVHQLQLSTDDAAKPTSNTWTVVSDERLKQNIQDFSDGLNVLTQLNPVSYELNGKGGTPLGAKGIGIIAQKVKDIIPYTINTFEAKLNPEDIETTTLYDFNSSALTFVTINAIKELNLNLNSIAGTITPLVGSANETFLNTFWNNLFAKVRSWLAGEGNGVEKLCINNTCLTETELQTILQNANITPSTPDPVPEPTPTPEPDPEVVPEPEPNSPLPESPQGEVDNSSTPADATPQEGNVTPASEVTPEPEPVVGAPAVEETPAPVPAE